MPVGIASAAAAAGGAGAGIGGAGLASIIGGGLGAIGSLMGQSSANSANASLNQANMDWQTIMSNTAVQRRAADMKAAGINPILAAGNPASQPAMSFIPMQNTMQSAGPQIGQTINSALQAQQTDAATKQINAVTDDKLPAEVANLKAQWNLTNAQAENAKAALDGIVWKSSQAHIDWSTADAQNVLAIQDARVASAVRDALLSSLQSDAAAKSYGLAGLANASDIQKSNIGKAINWLNAILQPVGTALGAARGLQSLRPSAPPNYETTTAHPDGTTTSQYTEYTPR